MTSIKTAVLALVAAALAGPVLAQATPSTQALNQSRSFAPSSGAAATLPNTFDAPVATAPAAPAAAPAVSNTQMAEETLRAVIEQFRAADIDERLFTTGVATRLNGQLADYSRRIRDYGAVQTIEAQGAADDAGQFLVTFENAVTQWQVGLDETGLIAAVRVREAPPESSEPVSPGA